MSAPDRDKRGDRPSRHGALLGDVLVLLAEAGNVGDVEGILDFMCASCAFRGGSIPNTSVGTALTAFNCAIGVDPDRFACHHGMKDGQPQKLCAGYLAAKNAPFEVLKAETVKLQAALSDLGDGDNTRDEFDKWADEIDPEYKLDVYEISRRWARRSSTRSGSEG